MIALIVSTSPAAPLPGVRAALMWTPTPHPTATNFIVYQSTNAATWMRAAVVIGTNAVVITLGTFPTYFRVTAATWAGDESEMSEQLSVINPENVMSVYGQHAQQLVGPWLDYQIPIFKGTNVSGMQFFRVRAAITNGFRTSTSP